MNKCQDCKKYMGDSMLSIKRKYINKKGIIIFYYRCKSCNSKNCRKYRKSKRGKIVWRKIMRKQYETHRIKILARVSLNYHLKKGYILKPNKCFKCKKVKSVEGHHHNYLKPLDVVWLCRSCHNLINKEL